MNIFFGAQSGFLNIFQEVDKILKNKGVLKESAYLVSDSEYYLNNNHKLPLKDDPRVKLLFEWNYTGKQRETINTSNLIKIKNKYSNCNLWDAIVCDRRLMYGKNTKLRQEYACKYTHEELCDIIYSSLFAIESIISKIKPDVIMTLTPSTYGDYLLYFAAKVNQIQYLQLKFTKVKNNIILSESFGAYTKEIDNEFQNNLKNNDYSFREEATNYIDDAKNAPVKYEGNLIYERPRISNSITGILKSSGGVIKRILSFQRRITKNDNHVPPVYSGLLYTKILSGLNSWISRKCMDTRIIGYDDIGETDFIFFPLHSEPETALSVHGVKYQNQIELIRRLCQCVPIGWKVLIKEHPRSIAYRRPGYYKKLLEIPNLYFVDCDTHPTKWIKKSRAVATISGFVGFEAMLMGKPVAVFGNVMYGILPESMVVKIGDLTLLDEKLRSLIRNYKYDRKALMAYVAACMKLSIPMNMYSVHLAKSKRVSMIGRENASEEIEYFSQYIEKKISSYL